MESDAPNFITTLVDAVSSLLAIGLGVILLGFVAMVAAALLDRVRR